MGGYFVCMTMWLGVLVCVGMRVGDLCIWANRLVFSICGPVGVCFVYVSLWVGVLCV